MKKAILALGVILVALLAIGSQAVAGDGATMHNCPDEGQWAISVWTGDMTDASEALGTCNIKVAYALTPTGVWLRYLAAAPEFNSLKVIEQYQGVFALGGPAVPVVPTVVSYSGTLPLGADPSLITMAIRSAGDGTYHARTGLHTELAQAITSSPACSLAMWTQQQMASIVEFCFYYDSEFLQCRPAPKASGDAHIYGIEVLVCSDQYHIRAIQHEYMQFYVGLGPDGEPRYARLGYGGKIPFNPTCPNDAWMWDERDPRGFWCEGYPDAVFGAYECGPDQEPVEGKAYCVR